MLDVFAAARGWVTNRLPRALRTGNRKFVIGASLAGSIAAGLMGFAPPVLAQSADKMNGTELGNIHRGRYMLSYDELVRQRSVARAAPAAAYQQGYGRPAPGAPIDLIAGLRAPDMAAAMPVPRPMPPPVAPSAPPAPPAPGLPVGTVVPPLASAPAAPRAPASQTVVEIGQPQFGKGSYYGPGDGFNGKLMACGKNNKYDMYQETVASPNLPCFSMVRVINLDNGRSALARVTDRGPAYGVVDTSFKIAMELGIVRAGIFHAEVIPVTADGVTVATTRFAAQNYASANLAPPPARPPRRSVADDDAETEALNEAELRRVTPPQAPASAANITAWKASVTITPPPSPPRFYRIKDTENVGYSGQEVPGAIPVKSLKDIGDIFARYNPGASREEIGMALGQVRGALAFSRVRAVKVKSVIFNLDYLRQLYGPRRLAGNPAVIAHTHFASHYPAAASWTSRHENSRILALHKLRMAPGMLSA
jgi:rare lipoprotein A (peptidoglycan hydrolase)